MGIESQWDGGFLFTPSLPALKLRGTPYDTDVRKERDFKFIVEREGTEDIDSEGWSVIRARRVIQGVEPAYRCAKSHNTQAQIQELFDFLKKKKLLPGRISGYIERITEDGDIRRLYERGGKVVEVEPTITWPGWED